MSKLTLADISDLRQYERERDEFRAKVIAEKRLRRVALGPVVTVVFENALTVRFQIQEMARAEKMSTDSEIQAELDAYNPLVPDPGELSLTMFIELTSESELREWLPKLVGIERAVGLSLNNGELRRFELDPGHESQLTRPDVTASVHYLRVQLSEAERSQFATGPAQLVVDHPEYRYVIELDAPTRATLVADWTS